MKKTYSYHPSYLILEQGVHKTVKSTCLQKKMISSLPEGISVGVSSIRPAKSIARVPNIKQQHKEGESKLIVAVLTYCWATLREVTRHQEHK